MDSLDWKASCQGSVPDSSLLLASTIVNQGSSVQLIGRGPAGNQQYSRWLVSPMSQSSL
jgi:hypothetical protein